MGDHIRTGGEGAPQTAVGVRELKTHAAGIVRRVREGRASYILTHRGQPVGVILPLEPRSVEDEPTDAAAWNAFLAAGRRLERRLRPGVSGVRRLSADRR